MNEQKESLFETLNLMYLTLKEFGPQAVEPHIDAPIDSWILRRVDDFSRGLIADIYRFYLAIDFNSHLFSNTFSILGPKDKERLSIEDQESHQIICKHFESVINGLNFTIASALAATSLPLSDYNSNSENLINTSRKRILQIWYNEEPTLKKFSSDPEKVGQAADDLRKSGNKNLGPLTLLTMDKSDLQIFLKTLSMVEIETFIGGLDSSDRYEAALINLLIGKLSKEQIVETWMNTQVFGKFTAESRAAAHCLWSRMVWVR